LGLILGRSTGNFGSGPASAKYRLDLDHDSIAIQYRSHYPEQRYVAEVNDEQEERKHQIGQRASVPFCASA